MISNLAASDIEEMKTEGLKPTVADIIRLNALGLKVERSQKCGDCYEIPRVSFLGSDNVFREPTVAHVIWTDTVCQYVNWKDYSTYLSVYAFAISRDPSELPDPLKINECIKAIDEYTKRDLAKFTFRQINAAVLYAVNGSDAAASEYPSGDDDDDDDVLRSVGVGVLTETLAMGLGVSARDVSNLTISQVYRLQTIGLRRAGIDTTKRMLCQSQDDYYSTLDEIKKRLTSEREEDNGE